MSSQPPKPFDCYLASSSPRRSELLQQIGVRFSVLRPVVDESRMQGESITQYVKRIATEKAQAGVQLLEAKDPGAEHLPVIGADTCGELAGELLVKPSGRSDALRMLQAMSGRTHRVYSAVAVVCGKQQQVLLSETSVRFRDLGEDEISRYWETGEPCDKAGAYAIQGLGAVFVESIEGSYSGVVGLPLAETCRLLSGFSVPWWSGNEKTVESNE